MRHLGDEEARRKADAFVVAPTYMVRAKVHEIVENNPTPNDKEKRDPWARVLGYEADKAVCRRCLKGFEEIPEEHLILCHSMTAAEYAMMYPDAVLEPAPLGDDEMTTGEWKGWAKDDR
jgi:hypothetical protein